jgi:hypothetical protein
VGHEEREAGHNKSLTQVKANATDLSWPHFLMKSNWGNRKRYGYFLNGWINSSIMKKAK